MTNNPNLRHYKPGLTMDTPVPVIMAAADWAILMAWHAALPVEVERGVGHIVYGVILPQINEALYTKDSLKAAEANIAERQEQHPLIQVIRGFTGQGGPIDPAEFDWASQHGEYRCYFYPARDCPGEACKPSCLRVGNQTPDDWEPEKGDE